MSVEAKDYKVLAAEQGNGTDKHGNVSYWLNLSDGFLTFDKVLKRQRPTSTPPEVGEEIFGLLEERTSQKGNTYYVFSTQRRDGQAWDDTRQENSSQNGSQSVSGPTRESRIVHQHSQEMALRAVGLLKVSITEAELKNKVKELADFFDQDVYRAGQSPTGADKTQTRGGEDARPGPSSPESSSGTVEPSSSPAGAPSPPPPKDSGGRSSGAPTAADLALRGKALDHEAVRLALVAVGATDVGDIPVAIGGLSESGRRLLAGRFYDLEKKTGIEWGPDEDLPFG